MNTMYLHKMWMKTCFHSYFYAYFHAFVSFVPIFMKCSPICRTKKLGMIYTIFGRFCLILNWEGAHIQPQIRLRKIPSDYLIYCIEHVSGRLSSTEVMILMCLTGRMEKIYWWFVFQQIGMLTSLFHFNYDKCSKISNTSTFSET